MSEAFVFICTKQTAPVHVPAFAATENDHRRNVNNAFSAISGGFRTVGQLAFFPLSSAVPDHLLCDGSTLEVASFPQLAAYLGATETTFDLPNYLTGLTFAIHRARPNGQRRRHGIHWRHGRNSNRSGADGRHHGRQRVERRATAQPG
jgi:hypothetical protein